MAGFISSGYGGSGLGSTGGYTGQQLGYGTPPPKPSNPLTTRYNLYNQGVKQQAEDYSGIMQGYKDLYNKALSTPQLQTPQAYTPGKYSANFMGAGQQYTPQNYNYSPTTQTSNSIANLGELAKTGGYSDQGIADLRARGISPIRAVYANAQRNIDRQRSLAGGYSPNYTAATTRMARELSDQIAGATQNVNAGIAQNVASNRISAASPYASAAGSENALAANMGRANIEEQNRGQQFNIGNAQRASEFNAGAANQAGMFNTGAGNEAARFNMQLPLQYGQYNQGISDRALRALEGQRSLYGTTPALSSLFGNQALQGAQLQQMINQQGNQSNLQAVMAGMR
jgi:hypothetical protein